MESTRRPVDVRYVATTTLVAVAVVMGSVGVVLAIGRLWRIITYVLVALFFAVILTPAIEFLQARGNMRRGVATLLVMLPGLAMLSGLTYAFVHPLVDQGTKFS